ncbi:MULTISPECIES: glutathione S-transferase family protein [Nocardiopsis]|uniref:Glutathione transferase n=1 Tax=Nocardiopsis dassonvillei (strain ATCC 23218 / DSM 43111 / CIP 107115 / JCM 7437 / KCTC 9190 / NBRC 14626 / NCTC 10488 / NRRL B-5397 / IMRU 509) TaxID=446468 RepID=D7B249_NOCDD|nr:glutathione S-transferase C-terminal domain-containing protein [Nocardiopsis dassonvillei]ADH66670.1 Glutathione transferase [Nocardiopsis dassonvillei subsp. dassonvillei DSM 43111]APC34971.1 glutathione-dependent reductase [Nocardiopsis dassonvillei]NKY80536.1 glutathione S-transferase family protein [Nocardiopsis dassonvillei]VEI92692.1 Glutathione S-transferase, C-terminal domain [Nocardiopsis dassonvillei]
MRANQMPTEEITRDPAAFADRVTADGRFGRRAEPGRYRLVVSRACPWAHRVVITRRLMGLEQAVSLAVTDPRQEVIEGDPHWVFTEATGSPGDRDPVLGIHALREAYLARDPSYDGGVSVPGLVDVESGHLVTNDFDQLVRDMDTEWGGLVRDGAPDLYPSALRDEIDALSREVYTDLNNGVYRAGFAPDQRRYDAAVAAVFARLDALEERLSGRRYLVGDSITEADIKLFPTLVRFDAAYHGHFKCNVRKLSEYPALWAYARDLFQTPGFGDTTDLDHVRIHYYWVHTGINPTRIIAAGPDPRGWLTPHHREELGGSPFGAGTSPGPVPRGERVPDIS